MLVQLLPAILAQQAIGLRPLQMGSRGILARRLQACEGVTADGAVVVGDPAGELVAATEDLDLLVLGSRRWGPVHRLALGSTSERVIRHAACPVLVPPRRADAEHVDLLLSALTVAAP